MDEFKLKNFNRFVENFKLKQQQEFKPTVEENVNEVVERLNLPEVKEKLDSIKFKGKEFGAFKELSDEEIEQALEKDSNKTKIIETLKKLNFKNVSQGAKEEICEVEGAKASPTVDDIEVGAGSGSTKRHVFKSVSFTAGLEYLNSLSVRTTRTTPSVEPPVVIPSSEPTNEPTTIPTEEPEITYAQEESLSRGTLSAANSVTMTATSEPKLLTLTNPFTGTNYKYTITSLNTSNHEVKFDFLANGRLVVTGCYVKIQAWDLNVGDLNAQHDDMIIVGSYNKIYTGKGDDIIRVGGDLADTKNFYSMNADNGGVKYYNLDYLSVDNTIIAGDGDDYVSMFGKTYTIDMGAGDNDRVLYGAKGYGESSVTLSNYQVSPNGTTRVVTGSENTVFAKAYNKTLNTIETTLDYIDGWARQGSDGDCQLFSFINSLSRCANNYDLSEIIQLTEDSNGYYVKFLKYDTSKWGNKDTAYITKIDLQAYTGLFGDITSRLLAMGMRQLAKTNEGFDVDSHGGNLSDFDAVYFARYLIGNENGVKFAVTSASDTGDNHITLAQFKEICKLYMFGDENGNKVIEAMEIGLRRSGLTLTDGEYQNSIIGTHAYAVKNIDFSHNDNNLDWIELVNPWDDADVLRLTVADYYRSYRNIKVLGQNLSYYTDRGLTNPKTN